MRRQFCCNLRAVEAPDSPLRQPSGTPAPDGYSGFAELATPRDDFLAWTRHCASRGLLLNPTVVHGGTTAAWEALHPGQQLLRINLSEDPTTLQQHLNLLHRSRAYADQS
ncbi:hypothetical protein [Streptomyces jumonjinensis]|uniref:hypothetical protein n=1 Tax=Streptomyces jumonjinensis TaxID=1945 RepID=UPI0037A285EB